MGIERSTRFICGLQRIEDTSFFPKYLENYICRSLQVFLLRDQQYSALSSMTRSKGQTSNENLITSSNRSIMKDIRIIFRIVVKEEFFTYLFPIVDKGQELKSSPPNPSISIEGLWKNPISIFSQSLVSCSP